MPFERILTVRAPVGEGENQACGEDSDCINRATKMECAATSGNCGGGCQNQRFQRKEWANVAVIKTEKKGYGLRADSDLQPNDFIYEYIGEVINEPTFRRRMLQYDQEGIKHFYFMSLSKSEFVDATRKGNLGRFCNHSCNPNCYVDKWVVGDKLRMGIFALRKIRVGEELVFNYNVDRYGAEPQPCYCGEANCVGFIGGKTQTERATKLPTAIVEALGIDDGDGWDTTVAKKPRRKRPEEDDEEYVESISARSLDEDDSRKVMAALLQCKEKWIAVKLLERIQLSNDDRVLRSVMRMHAYQILRTTLNTFIEDDNVVLQVLDILDKFPRMTRNKIQDSKIETTIQGLTTSNHDEVASKSKKLLEEWSKLEMAYRIRRRKVDPNAPVQSLFDDRRGQAREEETALSTPKTASPRPIDAPKGPKSSIPQRNLAFQHSVIRLPRRFGPLPEGWFTAKDARGATYYYNKQGKTTWSRPTQPVHDGPKAPSKAIQEQLAIQSIIDRVTKEGTPKQVLSQPAPPSNVEIPTRESKKDKWRSLPMDKQMKIYENTVSCSGSARIIPFGSFHDVDHISRSTRRSSSTQYEVFLGKCPLTNLADIPPRESRHGQIPTQAPQRRTEATRKRNRQEARRVRLQKQKSQRPNRTPPRETDPKNKEIRQGFSHPRRGKVRRAPKEAGPRR